MIVNWTKSNIKGIPIVAESRNIILAPGYNDVDDLDWMKVRSHVIDQIEAKIIDEEWIRVKKEEALKSKVAMTLDMDPIADPAKITAPEVFMPATIRDFNKNKAMNIVFKTYSKPTLERWNTIETRDEVTKAINYEIMWIDEPSKAQDMYGRSYGHGDSKE